MMHATIEVICPCGHPVNFRDAVIGRPMNRRCWKCWRTIELTMNAQGSGIAAVVDGYGVRTPINSMGIITIARK